MAGQDAPLFRIPTYRIFTSFLSVNCLGDDRSGDLLAWDGFPGEEP